MQAGGGCGIPLDGIVAHPVKRAAQQKIASDVPSRDVLEAAFPFAPPRASGENVKEPIGAQAFEFMISFLMALILSKSMENTKKLQLQARPIDCRSLKPQAIFCPSPWLGYVAPR